MYIFIYIKFDECQSEESIMYMREAWTKDCIFLIHSTIQLGYLALDSQVGTYNEISYISPEIKSTRWLWSRDSNASFGARTNFLNPDQLIWIKAWRSLYMSNGTLIFSCANLIFLVAIWSYRVCLKCHCWKFLYYLWSWLSRIWSLEIFGGFQWYTSCRDEIIFMSAFPEEAILYNRVCYFLSLIINVQWFCLPHWNRYR